MAETLLMTVEFAAQAGSDVLIAPFLPVNQYVMHDFDWTKRIKIVKPDQQVIEKDAEFGRAFDAPDVYILLVLNTLADEIPVGSQIWI